MRELNASIGNAALLSLLVSMPAHGQSAVRGVVRAAAGGPVLSGAAVSAKELGSRVAVSDSNGAFVLGGLPGGRLTLLFRAVGFVPFEAVAELSGLDTLELEVHLNPVAQRLAPLTVVSEPERLRRREGRITTQEIETVLGSASDAFEVVRTLRPSYLRGRGGATMGNSSAPTAAGLSRDTVGGGVPERVARAVRTAAARSGRAYLPRVSVDGGALQDLDVLRQIPAQTVKEIQLMSAMDAATQFGSEVQGGVIVVTLK